jgi:hypothetical protein
VDQLQFDNFKLERLRSDIYLRDGELFVEPLRMIALGGPVVGAFRRQLEGDDSHWHFELVGSDIDAAKLDSGQAGKNQGIFSTRVKLGSQGDSPHEVMSHLSGRVTAQAADTVLYGFELDRLAPDFLKNTLALFNPYKGEKETTVKTQLQCMVGHALFGEGLMTMDRSLLIRTPDSTFVVTWFIDFVTEEQRVQLIPRLRRGLGVSTTDLARTLHVSGTLQKPRLEVDPGGLLLVGAGSAALYVTGGWVVYFTWRQLERSMSRPDACEVAAEKYMTLDDAELKLPRREGKLSGHSSTPAGTKSGTRRKR